jgi:subtilisin family serine protease
MRKQGPLIAKALLLAGCWLLFLFQLAAAQGDPALTQVVAKLNPLSGATIADINTTYRTTTVETVLSSAGIYLLRVPAGINAPTLARRMAGDLRLLYAEPNFVGQAPEGIGRYTWVWGGGNAAPVNTQYAVRMLGLPAAHQISRGAGAVVAVIDRGVQLDHPALVNRWTATRYDFIDDDADPSDVANGIDEDRDGIVDDAYGHGTHVAGLVALVAPDARIMPLRALDTEARGDIFRLAEAIVYATDQGADVINLSLGTARKSELLNDVTRRATQQGVVVVAAAGNLGTTARQYPAGSQCALAVSALKSNRAKANFANYGSWIDLAAPGVSIYSAMPPSGYAWWSGTSMAAPLVVGHATLLRSFDPSLNPRQIVEHIAATALSLEEIDNRYGDKLGFGLPAVGVSLQQLRAGNLLSVGGVISGSCVDPVAAATVDEPAVADEVREPIDELALFNAIEPGDWADESAAALLTEAAGETMPQRLFLPLVAHGPTD